MAISLLHRPAHSRISSYPLGRCSDSQSIRQQRPMTSMSSCAGQQGFGVPDESWGGRSDSCRLLHTPEQPKGTITPAERLSGWAALLSGRWKATGTASKTLKGPQVRCLTHPPLLHPLRQLSPCAYICHCYECGEGLMSVGSRKQHGRCETRHLQ